MRILAFVLAASFALAGAPAEAADGATLVLREGQIVRTNYGYKQISEAFKQGADADKKRILELTIEGSSFLIDLSNVVIVCRDDCPAIRVEDPRQTSRRN